MSISVCVSTYMHIYGDEKYMCTYIYVYIYVIYDRHINIYIFIYVYVHIGALCQEFLTGTEFVIDGVSRDGVYKVTNDLRILIIHMILKCTYVYIYIYM
jgi:hypothetical protein